MQGWLKSKGVKTLYIQPGRRGRTRISRASTTSCSDECLNRELFGSLLEARVIIEAWRIEYNGLRPHSSLGHPTPDEFAAKEGSSRLRSGSALPPSRRTDGNNIVKPMAGLQL